MIAGVAAGLAQASGLDVTVVRICIGASLLTGLGWIGYILLWIVLPDEQPSRGRTIEPAPENTARIIRVALVIAALLGVLDQFGGIWPFGYRNHTNFGFDGVLGLILLSLGVGVLFSRHRPDRSWWEASPPPPNQAAAPPTVAPPAPAGDDLLAEAAALDDTVTFEGPFSAPTTEVHTAVVDAVERAEQAGTPDKPRTSAALGWARAVGWFVLLWWVFGVLGFVALWRYGALSVTAPVVVGVACWVVFTAVLNALIRVRRPAAVIGTLFLLLVPGVLGLAQIEPVGPVGTRTLRPIAASAVERHYRQAIGELELDFSATRFSKSRPTNVDARIGAGGMIVTVPNDVALTVNSRIDTGGYDILSKRTAAGVGQTETLRFPGCEGAPRLRLRLEGGAGWIQVKRANGTSTATCGAA